MDGPVPCNHRRVASRSVQTIVSALGDSCLARNPGVERFRAGFTRCMNTRCTMTIGGTASKLRLTTATLGMGPNSGIVIAPVAFTTDTGYVHCYNNRIMFYSVSGSACLVSVHGLRTVLGTSPHNACGNVIPISFTNCPLSLRRFEGLTSRCNL